jgi:hypothetical protein
MDVAGSSGLGTRFDGHCDALVTPHDADLEQSERTIIAWINFSDTNRQTIVSKTGK